MNQKTTTVRRIAISPPDRSGGYFDRRKELARFKKETLSAVRSLERSANILLKNTTSSENVLPILDNAAELMQALRAFNFFSLSVYLTYRRTIRKLEAETLVVLSQKREEAENLQRHFQCREAAKLFEGAAGLITRFMAISHSNKDYYNSLESELLRCATHNYKREVNGFGIGVPFGSAPNEARASLANCYAKMPQDMYKNQLESLTMARQPDAIQSKIHEAKKELLTNLSSQKNVKIYMRDIRRLINLALPTRDSGELLEEWLTTAYNFNLRSMDSNTRRKLLDYIKNKFEKLRNLHDTAIPHKPRIPTARTENALVSGAAAN